MSFPWRSCLGYRHAGCLQLSDRRPREMCGLRTRPLTDIDPPRFLDRTVIGVGAYRLAAPGSIPCCDRSSSFVCIFVCIIYFLRLWWTQNKSILAVSNVSQFFLCEGNYGKVCKGRYKDNNGKDQDVAVKVGKQPSDVLHVTYLSLFYVHVAALYMITVSALEVFLNDMRYINPRFTYLHTYLVSFKKAYTRAFQFAILIDSIRFVMRIDYSLSQKISWRHCSRRLIH